MKDGIFINWDGDQFVITVFKDGEDIGGSHAKNMLGVVHELTRQGYVCRSALGMPQTLEEYLKS